jgi:polar amino acid transport system substrate-binding protein
MNLIRFSTLACICAAGVFAGCGEKSEPAPTTTPSAANCAPSKLETQSNGVLTVATSKPAYPPYFEQNDPTNGKGFESAVAYAIAKQLGFATSDVKWVDEDFNASYSPGPKNFDFDVNQISITPARAKQVDFSAPYYTADQAVVALNNSPAAKATSLADLKSTEIGVQIGTTSLDAVKNQIQPTTQPKVFDNSNDVVTALKQGQVDAIVVDLPTALYITAAQVSNSSVVGQFSATGGKPDQFGALLEKNSSLTPCISLAINDLKKSGELQQITDRWMSQAANAPKLSQ